MLLVKSAERINKFYLIVYPQSDNDVEIISETFRKLLFVCQELV